MPNFQLGKSRLLHGISLKLCPELDRRFQFILKPSLEFDCVYFIVTAPDRNLRIFVSEENVRVSIVDEVDEVII